MIRAKTAMLTPAQTLETQRAYNRHRRSNAHARADVGDKRFRRIIIVLAAAYFGIAAVISLFMRYSPVWDMNALYRGAISWGTGVGITSSSDATFQAQTYFYYFPNNLGGTAFMALWFALCSLLGISDFLLCGFIVCAAGCALTFACTGLMALELGGRRAATASMLLYLATIPILFAAHMFYTDFLSMPFGAAGALMLLYADSAQGATKKLTYLIISCGLTAIGVAIKATVGIVAVAGLLCLIMKKDWKLLAAFAGVSAAAMAIVFLILNVAVYPSQLDRSTAKEMNTPTLHWIMMGLNEEYDGAYNSEDYEFTRSFTNTDERSAAVQKEIASRVDSLGLSGLLRLAAKKLGGEFGDGTASVGDFMPAPDANAEGGAEYSIKLAIYSFINKDGKYYNVYAALSNGARYAALILTAVWGLTLLLRKQTDAMSLLPLLCFAGVALFLCFWEANDRYVVNCLPFITVAAGMGAEGLASCFKPQAKK